MILKRTLTLLLLLACSTTLFAQDYKANVKQSFSTYYKYLVAGEFEKSMDYLPPAIFAVVPRAQMVTALKSVMTNPEIQIRLTSFEIKEILDKRKIDTANYVKIRYVGGITMKMKGDSTETVQERENRLNATKTALENSFGSGNVGLELKTETFTVTTTKNSWGISKNGITDWKFVLVDPSQRLILEKILPKEIIEESLN
ncbi:MAG: hypothetical protein V4687_16680 [Bacteroidota bacterium]